jgi:hypothetical protein
VTGSAEARADRLLAALAAIDRANADDPNQLVVDGRSLPKEQVHAELMTAWVRRLDPGATDQQLLAARAHHLRRWEVPRQDYPAGRAGYLRWRRDQKARHADQVGVILAEAGYAEDQIGRVGQIIRKEHLATDAQVQVHEDALCLTFLETQLDDLGAQLGPDKAVEVLAKTLGKMSPAGRAQIAGLALDDGQRALIEHARSAG